MEGESNLVNSIFRLTQFANIQKGNTKSTNKAFSSVLLTASPTKSANFYALPGTYINKKYIDKDVTTHYIDRCFLKYPKL